MEETLVSKNLPLEDAQKVYCTQALIELFEGLQKDGYSGLGLGLIVDLVVRDCHEV